MDRNKQIEFAKTFQKMHHEDQMMILANAWNGGSAKVYERLGCKAVGTTSAGVAFAMGFTDGEEISFDDLLRVTKEIINVIDIPLSVDMEKGYGTSPQEIKCNVRKIIEAGAVGINIEDGNIGENPHLETLNHQIEILKAIAEIKEETGIPFVINARTDAYWLKIGEEDQRLKMTIDRAKAYIEAGADCVFVPSAFEETLIQQLIDGIDAPLNIVANPVFMDIERLSDIGVKRLSIGSGAVRMVFANLIESAKELSENKSIENLFNHQLSYDKANEFFK